MTTPKNQGEGDRESAKRYNEDQRQFVGDHDERERERLAREAKPRDAAEAADLKQAEATGRERSKAGDESGAMADSASRSPRPAAGGGTDADDRDNPDRPGRNREMRGRDDNGSRRRGRFLRRRR